MPASAQAWWSPAEKAQAKRFAIKHWSRSTGRPLDCPNAYFKIRRLEHQPHLGGAATGPSMDSATNCTVWVNPAVDNFVDFCSVVTHEVGHLWGVDHSTDERSVMFHQLTVFSPCLRTKRASAPHSH